jgi:hypothetical protein
MSTLLVDGNYLLDNGHLVTVVSGWAEREEEKPPPRAGQNRHRPGHHAEAPETLSTRVGVGERRCGAGTSPFSPAQPRELCVQRGDGISRAFSGRHTQLDGFGGRGRARAACSLVPAACPTAARADAAQLLGGLIKEDVGVVGHGVPLHDHSSRELR